MFPLREPAQLFSFQEREVCPEARKAPKLNDLRDERQTRLGTRGRQVEAHCLPL